MPRGYFVTATDTGAGKTVLTAALAAAAAARGEEVLALKPFLTGLDEQQDTPFDDELLAACARMRREEVTFSRFGVPASPHLAARLAGTEIDVPAVLASTLSAIAARPRARVLVEGVGGLLVPLSAGWDVRRFARELGLPLLVAARPGLGTINHTLLTLEAARAAALDVRAVVLTPWPAQPDEIERSNRDTIAQLGGEIDVLTLPLAERLEPAALAAAGAALGGQL